MAGQVSFALTFPDGKDIQDERLVWERYIRTAWKGLTIHL